MSTETKYMDNCCTWNCCVHKVNSLQQEIRKHEVKALATMGWREGDEFIIPPTASKEKFREWQRNLGSLRDAQNCSLMEAKRHLDHCASVIRPGTSSSCGVVTIERAALQHEEPLRDISLTDQRKGIWESFKYEIAKSNLRAQLRQRDYLVQVNEIYQQCEKCKTMPGGQCYILERLVLNGLILPDIPPNLRSITKPPPPPELTVAENARLEQNERLATKKRSDLEVTLRSNIMKKFKALFCR